MSPPETDSRTCTRICTRSCVRNLLPDCYHRLVFWTGSRIDVQIYFVRKQVGFSGQIVSGNTTLSGLKRFLMDKLYNIDNLSVKCGSFPDKWSNICLCHWTVYRTSCIIYQRRSADNGNNESISYWVRPNTLRICPLEERKS